MAEKSYAVSLLDSEKRQENNDVGGVGFGRVYRFYIMEVTSLCSLLNAQMR